MEYGTMMPRIVQRVSTALLSRSHGQLIELGPNAWQVHPTTMLAPFLPSIVVLYLGAG